MANIQIVVSVAGANQASQQLGSVSSAVTGLGQTSNSATSGLNNVGAAATDAGRQAKTAGGNFMSLGTRIAGALGGVGLLVGGLFQLQDAFDNVAQADLTASRARVKAKDANDNRIKAEKKLTDAINGSWKADAKAGGTMVFRRGTTEEIAKAEDDLKDATDKAANATENSAIKSKEAAQAHQRLAFGVASSVSQMIGGVGTIIAFAKGVGGLGKNAGDAATGIKDVGGSFSGIASTIGKIAIPLIAIGAAFLIVKNNVFGARDALNQLGKAIGDAIPAAKPFLDAIKAIGAALGLAPDVKNWQSALKSAFAGITAVVTPVVNTIKQKFGEIAGSFQEFIGKLGKGDISGAFNVLKNSATKVFNDIKTAIQSVNWGAVWKGMQDAFNSTVNWIKSTAGNIGTNISAAIKNWNWGDAFKSLQTAFWSSVAFLKNVLVPVKATLDWVIDKIIKPGVDWLQKNMPTWEQVKISAHAALDWIWDNIAKPGLDWLEKNLPTWKQVEVTAHAVLKWTFDNIVWPTIAEIKKQTPSYEQITLDIRLGFKWIMEKAVLPSFDQLTADILNGIDTAIRDAPGAAKRIQDAIASLIPASVNAGGKKTEVKGIVLDTGIEAFTAFSKWLTDHLPKTIGAAQKLSLDIQIDTSKALAEMQRQAHNLAAGFVNSLIDSIKNTTFGGALANLGIKWESMKIPIILDTSKVAPAAQGVKNTLDTVTGKKTVTVTANTSGAVGPVNTLGTTIRTQIPGNKSTTFQAITGPALAMVNPYAATIETKVKPQKTTTFQAITGPALAMVNPYAATIETKVKPQKTTTFQAITGPALAMVNPYAATIETKIKPQKTTTFQANTGPALALVNPYAATIDKVKASKSTKFTADTAGANTSVTTLGKNVDKLPVKKSVVVTSDTTQAVAQLNAIKRILDSALLVALRISGLRGGGIALVGQRLVGRLSSRFKAAPTSSTAGKAPVSAAKPKAPSLAPHAAQGGSFIVSQPTRFGNLQVGEGFKPELITLTPLGGTSGGALLNVTPMVKAQHGLGGGVANRRMVSAVMNSAGGSSRGGSSRGDGSNSNSNSSNNTADVSKLIRAIEKLILLQARSKGLQANLIVDGQRMASVAQKYIGSKSYGDL